jgi:hypothetical protein
VWIQHSAHSPYSASDDILQVHLHSLPPSLASLYWLHFSDLCLVSSSFRASAASLTSSLIHTFTIPPPAIPTMSQRRSQRVPVASQRGGIDERAFPFDATGHEKPHHRTRAGLPQKHSHTHTRTHTHTHNPRQHEASRRQQAFLAYTFRRKPDSQRRPQSAPAFASDLGGSCSRPKRSGGVGDGQRNQQPQSSPRPRMRPNSAHFLNSHARSTVDLDVFPAPRPSRSAGGSRRPFSHPTPPTDNIKILTSHEKMFYTDHFSKLAIQRSESQKYKLDDVYNQQTRRFDNTSTTLFAPPDEVVTDYRLGRPQSRACPPRVVEHKKAGLLLPKAVAEKKHRSCSRNELGGFYC